MIKSYATIEYKGKTFEKLYVSGQIIKCEQKGIKTQITLSHYKGQNKQQEFTNNIIVNDNKVSIIKSLKKGTQLFCDVNIQRVEKNGKNYENLYLFNFDIGKEGKGECFDNNISQNKDNEEGFIDPAFV